jgi:hypothetical protein
MRPHRPGYPAASDTDFTKEGAYCKKELPTRRYIGTSGTAQFGGGIDVRTRLKLLFPIGLRGEVRDYYTLRTPRFGVPIQRREQHNVVVSAGLVGHC